MATTVASISTFRSAVVQKDCSCRPKTRASVLTTVGYIKASEKSAYVKKPPNHRPSPTYIVTKIAKCHFQLALSPKDAATFHMCSR